jgi:hypothetical protein
VTRAVAFLLAAVVALTACGPKPRVESARVGDPDQGIALVTVTVRNESGEGQIEVKVTLRDGSGDVVGRKEQTVSVREKERIRVVLDVPVGDATGLTVEAEVAYPPD